MPSLIDQCLQNLAAQNRKAVIPYIVAGDPTPAVTVAVMHRLVKEGADILELGVPFSDPMAEGPVIQLGHERALEHRVSLRRVLEMVAEFRQQDTTTPVVLMGYANPVEAMGYEAFANAAHQAGVNGVLTVDLPPEESQALNEYLKPKHIDTIFLIAPTTSDDRMKQIVANASGYIYYVSLKGVTGAGHLDTAAVDQRVKAIKAETDLPVCVGFGIKDAESARLVARHADGVVVGSVLVDGMASTYSQLQSQQSSELESALFDAVKRLLGPIVEGANAS